MKFSKSLIKTYKEVPKEAEVISHQLMLRSSMIKQETRGVYTYLPLAYRVLKKIENITREEMDKSGAQEILMPVLQPASLWEESGRWFDYGSELMRLKDRSNRDFALGPTHEEVITDIIRNMLSSYKELPINLYQIQTKFRDERRPRFGLMRGREFIMKDAYSFHLNTESLDEEYENMKNTYIRILDRIGLKYRVVDADTGSIGGDGSHEFMVLAESGEDDILYSEESSYAANVEKAKSIIDFKQDESNKLPKEIVDTPNVKTIDQVSDYLNVPKEKTLKAVMMKEVLKDGSTKYVLGLIRGDLDVNEVKLKNAVGASTELEMVSEDDFSKLNLVAGFIGSFEKKENLTVVLDETVKYMKNFVVGANVIDKHFINTNLEDLYYDKFYDIRTAKVGDLSPDGKGELKLARGIEVGHIFKLGTKYSQSLNATVLDENGRQKIIEMGCYGMGMSRLIAAAIEQNNDENGIIWPKAIAPYLVDVIITNIKDDIQNKLGNKIYSELMDANIDVILDDRNERAGFKFKDADLIGFPLKVIVGKNSANNIVEIKDRKTGETVELPSDKVLEFVKDFLAK